MAVVIETLDATARITECKEEKGTVECLAEYAGERLQESFIGKTVAGKVLTYTNIVNNVVNDVKECKNTGHSTAACAAGAVVGTAAMAATDAVATALIMNAPTTPAGPLVLATGIVGLMNSRKMGRDFAHLATEIVDYLIDHVPAEAIDINMPLIIRRNAPGTQETNALTEHKRANELVFAPQEVKLIRDLVLANQQVQRACDVVRAEATELTQQFQEFKVPLQNAFANYCEHTRRLDMNMTSIDTSRLLDRVHTDYIKCVEKSQRISNSSVSYNDRDGWKVSIGISYSFGGGGFCVIL